MKKTDIAAITRIGDEKNFDRGGVAWPMFSAARLLRTSH